MVDEKKKPVTNTYGKDLPAKVGVVKKTVPPATPKHGVIVRKIHHETEDEKIKKSLQASTTEGMFNNAGSSITSTFLVPLAMELKATNAEIGLLSAAQNFAITIGQIPGAKLTEFYSRKAIWMMSQLMSKIFLWLPVILLPFLGLQNPVTILIILMGLIAFFAALRAPAWSSLMGDLVPLKIRGKYFAMRNSIIGLSGVIATLITGYFVAYYGIPLMIFASVLLGVIAIFFFIRMYEPSSKKVFHYRHEININPRQWKMSVQTNKPLVIFTLYMLFMNFAVEIAAPFYTVYMIRDLGISYFWFAVLTIIGALVRIISFKYWGKLNDRFGSRKILVVTGFFGCFTPLLWLFVSNIPQIALLKLFDGFVWAGFDLVVFNYLLDITPSNKRPQFVANHNFFSGFGIVTGALVGGFIAQTMQSGTLFWFHGLQILFIVSFIIRLLALSLLAKIREADIRHSELVPLRYVFWQSMAIEPAHGLKSSINFTFRYPEKVVKELESSVKKIKYKVNIKKQ